MLPNFLAMLKFSIQCYLQNGDDHELINRLVGNREFSVQTTTQGMFWKKRKVFWVASLFVFKVIL